ncbi:hypothetical protein BM1_00049 [Bipolaris maydis]|nr:hypothetical protein BM1_00049 [Bipolaris maydis]
MLGILIVDKCDFHYSRHIHIRFLSYKQLLYFVYRVPVEHVKPDNVMIKYYVIICERAIVTQRPTPSTPHPKKRTLIIIEDSPSSYKRSRLSFDALPTLSALADDDNDNEQRREKKRREIGLQPPTGPKPLDREIVKQPVSDTGVLYSASSTPYYTACTLLDKFLQMWRQQGTPFQTRADSRSLRPHVHLQQELMASASQGSSPDSAVYLVDASKALESCIERNMPLVRYKIEEIPDSEDDDDQSVASLESRHAREPCISCRIIAPNVVTRAVPSPSSP